MNQICKSYAGEAATDTDGADEGVGLFLADFTTVVAKMEQEGLLDTVWVSASSPCACEHHHCGDCTGGRIASCLLVVCINAACAREEGCGGRCVVGQPHSSLACGRHYGVVRNEGQPECKAKGRRIFEEGEKCRCGNKTEQPLPDLRWPVTAIVLSMILTALQVWFADCGLIAAGDPPRKRRWYHLQ